MGRVNDLPLEQERRPARAFEHKGFVVGLILVIAFSIAGCFSVFLRMESLGLGYLPRGVIFLWLLLLAGNALVYRISPRRALSRRAVLWVLVMMLAIGGLVGEEFTMHFYLYVLGIVYYAQPPTASPDLYLREIPPALVPISRKTIAESVTDRLRARILRGNLKAGTRLKEEEVARVLGVSATPVRHAIRRLADQGLVEIIPHRGAYVTELTPEDIVSITELRELHEVCAFRKSAPHITDADLERLTELHQAYHDAYVENDYARGREADQAFHEYVVARSGNRWLADVMRRVSILTAHLDAQLRVPDTTDPVQDRDCHLLLLEALATRDPDAAEKAIRQHIRKTFESFTRAWAVGPTAGSNG